MPNKEIINPDDVAYAFDLPDEDAIAYLKQKGYQMSWDWKDVSAEAHQKAFTVAKATCLSILTDIRKMVEKAQAEGITLEQFKAELEPKLVSHGWWGKKPDFVKTTKPDGSPGMKKVDVQLGTPWRLQTIYRTNMQSSYMAGRFKQQQSVSKRRPYIQYIAVGDNRSRPRHAVLDGKVLRADDPFWSVSYPPNGYNC